MLGNPFPHIRPFAEIGIFYLKLQFSAKIRTGGLVIRRIFFRSDWSYFMNFRVIDLIKLVPASKFRRDWSCNSQFRKKELLHKLENLTGVTGIFDQNTPTKMYVEKANFE